MYANKAGYQPPLTFTIIGGRSSVVRESEFKTEDPGFDALAEQGEERVFCPSESTLVPTCLCMHDPVRVYGTRLNCALVKDPISICRERV